MNEFLIILVSLSILAVILYLGDFKIDFKITKEKKEKKNNNTPSQKKLELLSITEIKIFDLCIAGKSNQEIANEMFISVNTVKKHVSNIFKKLKINSRKELIQYKIQINQCK